MRKIMITEPQNNFSTIGTDTDVGVPVRVSGLDKDVNPMTNTGSIGNGTSNEIGNKNEGRGFPVSTAPNNLPAMKTTGTSVLFEVFQGDTEGFPPLSDITGLKMEKEKKEKN